MCNAQLSTSGWQELLICVTAGQAVALQTHLKNTQSDLDAFHLILDPYLISQECSQGSEGPFFADSAGNICRGWFRSYFSRPTPWVHIFLYEGGLESRQGQFDTQLRVVSHVSNVKWAEEKMCPAVWYSVGEQRAAVPLSFDIPLGTNFSGH